MAEIESQIEELDLSNIEDEDSGTPDEISYEQAIEWKKKAERLDKAEKKLVELKKQAKETHIDTKTALSEQDLDMRDEIRDFIKDNPEYKDYKDEIIKHRKSGYSLKQAVAIIENDDNTIENRKKTNSMNLTNGETTGKTVYTYNELEKMSQSEYNKIKELQLKGKVKFKD